MSRNDFDVIMQKVEQKLISLEGKPITQAELVRRLHAKKYCLDKSFAAAGVFIRTEIIPAIEKKWYQEKGKYFLCSGSKGFYIAKNAEDAANSLNTQLSRIREQYKRWEAKTAHFNVLFPDGKNQLELDFQLKQEQLYG